MLKKWTSHPSKLTYLLCPIFVLSYLTYLPKNQTSLKDVPLIKSIKPIAGCTVKINQLAIKLRIFFNSGVFYGRTLKEVICASIPCRVRVHWHFATLQVQLYNGNGYPIRIINQTSWWGFDWLDCCICLRYV